MHKRNGTITKIGCIVFVQLSVLVRFRYVPSANVLFENSAAENSKDGLVLLFMN